MDDEVYTSLPGSAPPTTSCGARPASTTACSGFKASGILPPTGGGAPHMLKVKRLEISGFKSFVDPVKVDFAGGVTAIVGPNGCGKSNLSEAMTWVLGEQSAKTLRGGTMEDVIFNGSEQR